MSLAEASALLAGSGVGLGAQIMHGKIRVHSQVKSAPGMVKELCSYVIFGHSERRADRRNG